MVSSMGWRKGAAKMMREKTKRGTGTVLRMDI
jgi:hypothetical protein